MKKFIFGYFLLLITLVSPLIVIAEDTDETTLLSGVGEVATGINNVTIGVGLVKAPCPSCDEKTVNKKIILKESVVDMGYPYFIKTSDSYLVRLVRTSSSPKKIDLRFKNSGGSRCAVPADLATMAQGYGTCVMYGTESRDEEINLDLSDLPPLEVGKEDIIEFSLSKSDLKKFPYKLDVDYVGSEETETKISEKSFLSWFVFSRDGYNVKIKPRSK